MSIENKARSFFSSTVKRAALLTSSLGEVNITKALASIADISEDRKNTLLAIAHRMASVRFKERVVRDTERYNEHKVKAYLLGRNFQQTGAMTPQSQQNTSPDQPQDHF